MLVFTGTAVGVLSTIALNRLNATFAELMGSNTIAALVRVNACLMQCDGGVLTIACSARWGSAGGRLSNIQSTTVQ